MSAWRTHLTYGLALGLSLSALAPRAQAQHGDLAMAERLIENAEFEQAANLLQSIADQNAGLSREDVAELLRLRAVVRSALGRDREADRDLAALARVLAGREPGPLPDMLQRRYERHRRRVRGTIEASVLIEPRADGEVTVRLEIDNDPSRLVRRQELVCYAGDREVASTDADRLTVSDQTELRCEAAAFGPGGWRAAEASTTWRSSDPETPGEPSWFDESWPYLVGGGAGAVGLIVLISVIVYATAPTGVSGPMWVPTE